MLRLYYRSMKLFYLVGSVIFTVLILIIAFQNYGANFGSFALFFSEIDTSPTIVIFGIALLGIFAGGFYFGFLNSLFKGNTEEEEEAGGTMQ